MLKQGAIVVVSTALVYWIVGHTVRLGFFREVYNHAPGDCFHLPGLVQGSEDIQVLANGQAFISAGFNAFGEHRSAVVGRIYLFDFNHPKTDPLELKIVGYEKYKTLNPHGINLWTNPETGGIYLYVINHTPGGDAVDKFKFDNAKKTLEHIRRIENEPKFYNLNDLTVVEEDQFYYTNSRYFNVLFEIVFGLHWGSVGFFNGKNATIVETGLLVPNGIAVSKDRRNLYVAHVGKNDIRVYQRNDDNSLSFRQSIYLGTLADNLDVDFDTGDIWMGAHPSWYKFIKYVSNVKENIAPSQVLRVKIPVSDPSSPEIVEVYSNDGNQLSGSSIAVRYKNAILIGSVLDRALYCPLNCA